MDEQRLYTLLFNAIDLLLKDYDRYQIMDELGMAIEELENVGETIGCYYCNQHRTGREDGVCIHYIERTCPYNFYDREIE